MAAAAMLDAAREELRVAAARGIGGRATLGRYTERVDVLLRQLFDTVAPAAQPVSVIALGGYGRRELCLHSDIDLLILFEKPLGTADESFLPAVLNPLWDLGVAVGHQVRELDEFSRLEADNPEFLLALLDARPAGGRPRAVRPVLAAFHQPASHAQILAMLLTLIEDRHQKFNDTLYQLEPDIKEAPGRAARRHRRADDCGADRSDAARPRPGRSARLDEATDYLLRIRSLLHLETERNSNVLTHELQEKTAESLGYPGTEPRQRVERMMSDYFRHARAVSRSLQWVRRRRRPRSGRTSGDGRGVRFIDSERAGQHPEPWLRAFQAAIDEQCAVHRRRAYGVRETSPRFAPRIFSPRPAARDELLRFLRPRPGLYARLSEMHDAGLLGQMFPEFQAISWRVVRDFYHKYTVDEHTLLTIRNLERLATPCPPGPSLQRLLPELEQPELLVLSLLFHDVGKWRDEDHAIESVRMAHQMLERLQMPEDAEVVDFLSGITSGCRARPFIATPKIPKSSRSSPPWSVSRSG